MRISTVIVAVRHGQAHPRDTREDGICNASLLGTSEFHRRDNRFGPVLLCRHFVEYIVQSYYDNLQQR